MKLFLGGMFFALVGISILDDLTSLITNKTQLKVMKYAEQMCKIKQRIKQINDFDMDQSSNCVGFQCQSEEQIEETY